MCFKNSKIINLILIILGLTVLLFAYLSFAKPTNDLVEVKKHSQEQALAPEKIKIGYLTYPPSFMQDPNTGQFSGIFYDLITEIGKELNLELEFTEELGWATMIEAVKAERVDLIVTGIWPTKERAEHVNFTIAPYNSIVKAYVRADDSRFDGDLTKINSSHIKIATVDGEMTSVIARDDYPNAKLHSLSQLSSVSQVLLEVATKKADATFVEPAIALEYMHANPGKIKEVEGVQPLRSFPNGMVVKKDNRDLLNTLNSGVIELINNGFVDGLLDKYEKYPNSFQRVSAPFNTK